MYASTDNVDVDESPVDQVLYDAILYRAREVV